VDLLAFILLAVGSLALFFGMISFMLSSLVPLLTRTKVNKPELSKLAFAIVLSLSYLGFNVYVHKT
jgi:hypothetical protein